MSKLDRDQTEEIARCAVDFPYFCEHYVKVLNYEPGSQNSAIVPFKLHPYQEKLYDHMEANRFTIFSKFRQGGFSTAVAIYGLWKCLFRMNQNILWLAKSDREATEVCDRIVKRALEYMPEWMKGNVMKMTNSHQKSFPETDSHMFFGAPEAACGKAASLLVVDDASFIQDMDQHWKAMWPVVSCGGSCCIMSSVTTDEDWFWNTLENAKLKMNTFTVFQCHYRDRPEFCDPQWESQTKSNLGAGGWNTEYEQKPVILSEKRLTPEAKPKTKLWRSIFDEWEGGSEETAE